MVWKLVWVLLHAIPLNHMKPAYFSWGEGFAQYYMTLYFAGCFHSTEIHDCRLSPETTFAQEPDGDAFSLFRRKCQHLVSL